MATIAEQQVTIPASILTRLLVEDFVYREAAMLDNWRLDDWFKLFSDPCDYEVTPPGVENPEEISRREVYFLIGDDRKRLEHRVKRLKQPNAHAESPRSQLRRIYGNVIIMADDGDTLTAHVNFITFRTKRGTVEYFGLIRFILKRVGDSFIILSKRIMLDQDNLVPQGRVSLLL